MYGIEGTNVYMGVVTVAARTTTTADVSMSAGIAVDGTVTYNGAAVSGANVVFSNNARLNVTSRCTARESMRVPASLARTATCRTGARAG
jgi:hypothetical protein